jgi:RNA recognition motif-containing protein
MQGKKLYVGNLGFSVTQEQLSTLFGEHGEVQKVDVIEGKGFAFVEMADSEAAETAKEALDGAEFDGRTLKVDEARPPRSGPRDGSRGGPRGGSRGGPRGGGDRRDRGGRGGSPRRY